MTLYSGAVVHSNPSLPTATSSTLLAANTSRRFLIIYNNSGGNIVLNFAGETLTSTTPSSTNKCVPLANASRMQFCDPFVPTGAITVYHGQAGTITSVSVVEG